jgi:transglutaminase-like putative cysteine protease
MGQPRHHPGVGSMTGRTPAQETLLGLALVVAVVPLLTTWSAVVKDTATLVLVGGAALAVLAAGIVVRAFRARERVAMVTEAIVFVGWVAWLGTSFGGVTRLPTLLGDGVRHLQTSVAPVTPSPGTTVVLCLVAGLLALLTDWLVVALDRPVAVLIPMLTLLLVPSLTPRMHRPPDLGLALFALGIAIVLLASHRRAPSGRRPIRLRPPAVGAAALATVLALVGAFAIAPRIPVPPSNRGSNGEPIQMSDVSLELKRQISQGANRPAFDYATDDGAAAYLRLYSLPTFSAEGWRLTDSSVQLGRLGTPPGLTSGTPRHTSVTITGLTSEWLPAPYAPVSTSAGDQWGYLPDSLSILALGVPNRTGATTGLRYTVDSLDGRPTSAQLTALDGGSPPDASVTGSVPSDISPTLVRLAGEITNAAPTAGAKALAILNYLHRPEFTYSLDAQPGSGYPGLEDFLLKDHKGFCVQYAASMAILARIAGIPSRVAIGFTPGKRVGDHWTVTMHDMHAWPELYLNGWGWVAFEPTPGVGVGPSPSEPGPATPTPTEGASPTPTASVTPSIVPTKPTSPGAGGWLPWGLGALVVALIVAASTVPSAIRGRLRKARLAGGRDRSLMALDAWDELRATTLDYRLPWPEGSPRFAGPALTHLVPGRSGDGVQELALAAERARFGGPGNTPDARDWAPVASAFTTDIEAGTPSRWARLRARLFPVSLLG